ncbi:MAG: hypothetical protein ACFFE8_05805 [Candidatus Heimdallarchaeota archaeon]
MGFYEFLIISLPLLILAGLASLNWYFFLKNYLREGEETLLHSALVFVLVTSAFLIIAIAGLLTPEDPIIWFMVAHFIAWLIFLEIASAYFSTFINRSRSVERYVLPILGAGAGLALFGVFNPDFYVLAGGITAIDTIVYAIGIFSLLFVLLNAYNRISSALGQYEADEELLLVSTTRELLYGAIALTYTFISVGAWLIFKTPSQISLIVSTWDPYDWIVYLNIPIYFIVFMGALVRFSKLKFENVNIADLFNILDSPQD